MWISSSQNGTHADVLEGHERTQGPHTADSKQRQTRTSRRGLTDPQPYDQPFARTINIMCGGVRALRQVRGKDTAERGKGTLHSTGLTVERNDSWLRLTVVRRRQCHAIRDHREDGALQSPLIFLEAPLITLH